MDQPGAKNEICNPNYGQPIACAAEGITYSGYVQKIVNNQCVVCHKASNPSGGIRLDSYDAVLASVQNGGFLGSIEGKPTFTKCRTMRTHWILVPLIKLKTGSVMERKTIKWLFIGLLF